MRMIDADALRMEVEKNIEMMDEKRLESYQAIHKAEGATGAMVDVLRMIDASPTVDAEPVRNGRWIQIGRKFVAGFLCSECHLSIGNWEEKRPIKFCPNCGAKMDGGNAYDVGSSNQDH